jgi:hypothetical protein
MGLSAKTLARYTTCMALAAATMEISCIPRHVSDFAADAQLSHLAHRLNCGGQQDAHRDDLVQQRKTRTQSLRTRQRPPRGQPRARRFLQRRHDLSECQEKARPIKSAHLQDGNHDAPVKLWLHQKRTRQDHIEQPEPFRG